MSTLRTRMDNALIARGRAEATRRAYLRAVERLAKHYGCSPEYLSAEQVQAYIAYLHIERGMAWGTCGVAAQAFRFLYHTTLGRQRMDFVVPGPRRPAKLPEILSFTELERLFAACSNTKHRALLMTTYAAGLRVSEVVRLRVDHIDSVRGTIRVEQAKGMRDRYTLLSPRLLAELRAYWRAYRPQPWLFPRRGQQAPMSTKNAHRVFTQAKARAGITKSGGIHSLRHSFATHMLEAGVDIYTIQRLLGHKRIASTLHYFRLATAQLTSQRSPLDLLELPPPPGAD